MTTVDWVIIAFLAWGAISGFLKGFIRACFGMVGFVAGLVLGILYAPAVADWLDSLFNIRPYLTDSLHSYTTWALPATTSPAAAPAEQAALAINELSIPGGLKSLLLKKVEAFDQTQAWSGFSTIGESIAEILAQAAVYALGFCVIVLAVGLLTAIITFILERVAEGFFVRDINRVAGMVFGIAQNGLIIMLLLGVISPFLTMGALETVGHYVEESWLAGLFTDLFYYLNPWEL